MSFLEIFDPAASPRPIGIDLGTTNSIVARMRDGDPCAIRDCDGEALMPDVADTEGDATVVDEVVVTDVVIVVAVGAAVVEVLSLLRSRTSAAPVAALATAASMAR